MSILRRERRKKARKEAYKIKWKDCSIPAKLFFDEVIKGNYSVLGNAPVEQLEKAYWDIMDEYVKISNNEAVMSYLVKHRKISVINAKISTIKEILYSIAYVEDKHTLQGLISALNLMESPKIDFNVGSVEDRNLLIDEIQRVNNEVVGVLENEIDILTMNDKEHDENAIGLSYEDRAEAIMDVRGRDFNGMPTLREFVAAEKRAHQKIKAHGKQ